MSECPPKSVRHRRRPSGRCNLSRIYNPTPAAAPQRTPVRSADATLTDVTQTTVAVLKTTITLTPKWQADLGPSWRINSVRRDTTQAGAETLSPMTPAERDEPVCLKTT